MPGAAAWCSRLGGIFVELRPEKVGYGQCRQTILHLRNFSRHLLRAYDTCIAPYLNSDAQQQASAQEGGGGAGPSGSAASGATGAGGSGGGAVPHAEPEAIGEVRTQWQLLRALLVGRQDEIEDKMEGLRQMEVVAAQQEQQQPAGTEAAAAEAGAEDVRQEGSDGENAADPAAGDNGGEHSGLQRQESAAYRTRAKKRESEAQSEGPGSAGTPVKRGKRATDPR